MSPVGNFPISYLPQIKPGQATGASGSAEGQAIPMAELQKLTQGAQGMIPTQTDGPKLAPTADLPAISNISSGGGAFGATFNQFVQDVAAKSASANQAVDGLLSGQNNVSLHQAMISMEESNISFQLMVEVRNKLLESYQELMRMQV